MDISSLTPKPEDHASSVVLPSALDSSFLNSSKRRRNQDVLDEDQLNRRRMRSRQAADESPSRILHALSGKDGRVELLEENRMLRVQLDATRYRTRRMKSELRRLKRLLSKQDSALAKYRAQLLGLFEDADEDIVQIRPHNNSSGPGASAMAALRLDRGMKETIGRSTNRLDAESCSNSQGYDQDEDWLSFSAGSEGSPTFDTERIDDGRSTGGDGGNQSEATLRKRTRAPAWSAEEELKFMQTYDKYGCQWKMFQTALPGRSRRQIQSHGSYLIRQGKLTKKNSRPWQRRKPRAELGGREDREDIDVDQAELDNEE